MRTVTYIKIITPYRGVNNACQKKYVREAEGKIFDSIRDLKDHAHQHFGGIMNENVRLVRV